MCAPHFVSNLGQITTPYCKRVSERNRVAVLRTNRQVYLEARGVLYGLRKFSIGINQMSCIGNGSKPSTPMSYHAIPATWNERFREHLYLMTMLNIYVHLDKAVLKGSNANASAEPDSIITEAIGAAILGADRISNPALTNISLHQMLQTLNGNAAMLQLPNLPAAAVAANLNAHANLAATLAVNPAINIPINPAANALANPVGNIHGAGVNLPARPSLSMVSAFEYQNMDNVMVIKAALEELCNALSMCRKLKDINVIYIDTLGDSSPGGLGFNVLRPFKNLARSVRCHVTYIPIPGYLNQPTPKDTNSSRMEGFIFKQDTTFHDTLCHLKAISVVSNVKLMPGWIAELERRLDLPTHFE